MPTTLARIQVTQTPPVARALMIAEQEWPGVPRSELVARLMERGADALDVVRSERRAARRAALARTRASVQYPSDYLAELREDWPE